MKKLQLTNKYIVTTNLQVFFYNTIEEVILNHKTSIDTTVIEIVTNYIKFESQSIKEILLKPCDVIPKKR